MSYQLTGPVGAFGSWNLLYGADLYRGLSVTGNDAPGVLSALVSEPVPALGADGQLTVTALEAVDGSFRAGVSVSFTWLGVGQPGSQAYQVLDESFNVVGAGDSLLAVAAPVPEPTSLTMGLLGGALLALRRRRSLPD